MPGDAWTLVAILALVLVASLASYYFSQLAFARNSGRPFAWAGVGVGTICLLVGAVIVVVLCVAWVAKLRLADSDADSGLVIQPAQSIGAVPTREIAEEAAPAQSPESVSGSAARLDIIDNRAGESHEEEQPSESLGSAQQLAPTLPRSEAELRASKDISAHVGSSAVLATTSPWGATECVVSTHPDPADLTRWKIENECGVPVGILVATCEQAASDCDQRVSASWKYLLDGLILPAKYQRSVTAAEQTQFGQRLEHLACVVTTPRAIELIGMDSEARASSSWRTEFESIRDIDVCLSRVRRWADAGRRTGVSIEALLGEKMSNLTAAGYAETR